MENSEIPPQPPRAYCIAINTDASHHSKTKIGAYAYYIRTDALKIKNYGIFRTRVRCANICELLAIGNAIAHLLQQPDLPAVQKVIINTDSQSAIQRLTRGENHSEKKETFAAVMPRIFTLLTQLRERTGGAEIDIRHVRAHANVDDAKSRANQWCDTQARRALRAAINGRRKSKK